MGKIEVIFYDTPNGDEPAREFLDSLDKKMQAKMAQTIAMLRDYGWELRAVFKGYGFIKKTQKTSPREIERAKRYRKEFLKRTENRHD